MRWIRFIILAVLIQLMASFLIIDSLGAQTERIKSIRLGIGRSENHDKSPGDTGVGGSLHFALSLDRSDYVQFEIGLIGGPPFFWHVNS